MTTQHTATLPDNTIGKRTSANRVYPYCVALSPTPKAERVAELRKSAEASRRYAARHAGVVEYLVNGGEIKAIKSPYGGEDRIVAAGLGNPSNPYRLGYGDVTRESVIAKEESYRDDSLASAALTDAKADAVEAGPDFIGTWGVTGWQSRLDLATKELAKMQAAYPLRTAVIVESVMVTK